MINWLNNAEHEIEETQNTADIKLGSIDCFQHYKQQSQAHPENETYKNLYK